MTLNKIWMKLKQKISKKNLKIKIKTKTNN